MDLTFRYMGGQRNVHTSVAPLLRDLMISHLRLNLKVCRSLHFMMMHTEVMHGAELRSYVLLHNYPLTSTYGSHLWGQAYVQLYCDIENLSCAWTMQHICKMLRRD